MKFPVLGASDDSPGSGTIYAYLASQHNINWNATENRRIIMLSEDITITEFTMMLDTAPGASASRTYTLRKNGADTAVTVTFGAADVTQTWTGSVSFSAGDLIGLQHTATGTPTAPGNSYWYTMMNTTGNKALLMSGGANVVDTSATNYQNPFGGTSWVTAVTDNDVPVPTPGNITKLAVTANSSPGSGKSYNISVRLNNASDNLTVNIANGATSGSATGSVALVATDAIVVKSAPSGTPTGLAFGWCVTFEPTTAGETFIGFGVGTALSTSSTQYNQPQGTGAGFSTTESAKLMKPPEVTFKKMYVRITAAPGVASSRVFTLRDNGGSSALTVTISGLTDTTGNDTTNSVAHTAGNSISLQSVPNTTPAAADLHASMVIATTQPAAATATGGTLMMMGV